MSFSKPTKSKKVPSRNTDIRQSGRSDIPALRVIRREALQTEPLAFTADLEAEAAIDWAGRLEDPNGAIFLAFSNHEPVGMTGIVQGRSSKTRHSAMIWGVYVSPAYRRQGIARALLENAFDWAGNRGILTVRLGVTTVNFPALQFYSRLGFTIYGTEPMAMIVNGKRYDEYLMARGIE